MATLPTFEERVKSFKTMIYKPEQIPQLADDLPSEDELHLLFSLIGLSKLSETDPSDIQAHFLSKPKDIELIINLFFHHDNMDIKRNCACILSHLVVKSSVFGAIYLEHNVHKYAIGMFSLNDNQLTAYVVCIIGNLLVESTFEFEESLLTNYMKKFLELSKNPNFSKQLKTDLVWALSNCTRRKPSDPEAYVPAFTYFGRLLSTVKHPSTDLEFSNDVLWSLVYLSDSMKNHGADEFEFEEEFFGDLLSLITNKAYDHFAKLAVITISNIFAIRKDITEQFLQNKEFMAEVYNFSEDNPDHYPIIGELYNGLGRLQKLEHIRVIVSDERVAALFKAIESFPDLEVRFRVLRFLSLIGKYGEEEDVKLLLKRGINESVFQFLGYKEGPLRKNDIRACLKMFIYLIKKAEVLTSDEIDIRKDETFQKKIGEELEKHNSDDIGEINELKNILDSKLKVN